MAGKKKLDPIKQREKRAKIAAVAGVVLLLGVAAFEVPKMMKLMHPKPLVPPPTAAAPAGTASLPGADGTPVAGTTPSGQLADTDLPPASVSSGQLISFDVFETKDPFRPQVTNAELAAADAASSGSAPSPATETPAGGTSKTPAATASTTEPPTTAPAGSAPPTALPSTAVPSAAVPSTGTPSSEPKPATTAKPATPTVSISVNGVSARVTTGGTFPKATPVFRLVSWAKGTARVGIVGGSYSSGDPALELTLDKAVTLRNTSNGQQYKLVLLSTP
jgi:hypothetical protein